MRAVFSQSHLFGMLNLVQGAAIGAVPLLLPSREPTVNWLLGAAAVAMLAAAPAIAFGGKIGRFIALIACLYHWLLGVALTTLIAASGSYLYGIYGRHGHSAGSIAFVLAAIVLLVFWLIPGHELHYLRKKWLAQ